MNDILREYLDLIAVGILDDVIIFSESLPEHIPHCRNILEVLPRSMPRSKNVNSTKTR